MDNINTKSYVFPEGFVWGTATAATQIEGAADLDGKGESIWDHFSNIDGKIENADTPAVACDHYHKFEEDFDLMKSMGVRNYRFSIAWPRIHPNGDGVVNPEGIAFYNRLIDAMLERDIEPWVTFFHWDLPQALEDIGGWRSCEIPKRFALYADEVVKAFGDRVSKWITLNEIPCFVGLGYGAGVHAPGARESGKTLNQIYHHALLAHGYAVKAVREHGSADSTVGLTHNPDILIPVTESEQDIEAARILTVRNTEHILGPIFQGSYSEEYLERCGEDRPVWEAGDMELISQPTDFLGLNVYAGNFVRMSASGEPEKLPLPKEYPIAGISWMHLSPQCIYWIMRLLNEIYDPKAFYITENGACYESEVDDNGEVIDLHRREYIRNYLLNVHRAVDEEIPCKGYFVWSFMDNFEWACGYEKRFGIVHVDFETQKRTPKLSAQWYAEVVKSNRIV